MVGGNCGDVAIPNKDGENTSPSILIIIIKRVTSYSTDSNHLCATNKLILTVDIKDINDNIKHHNYFIEKEYQSIHLKACYYKSKKSDITHQEEIRVPTPLFLPSIAAEQNLQK